MIGVESPNNGKLFYNFNLEKKVRKNHPLRKLKEILNLDFMYVLLKDKYGYNGNVSVPPPVAQDLPAGGVATRAPMANAFSQSLGNTSRRLLAFFSGSNIDDTYLE